MELKTRSRRCAARLPISRPSLSFDIAALRTSSRLPRPIVDEHRETRGGENDPPSLRPAVFTLALLFNPFCCSCWERTLAYGLPRFDSEVSTRYLSPSMPISERGRSHHGRRMFFDVHTLISCALRCKGRDDFWDPPDHRAALVSDSREINSFASVNVHRSISLSSLRALWDSLVEILL